MRLNESRKSVVVPVDECVQVLLLSVVSCCVFAPLRLYQETTMRSLSSPFFLLVARQ